MADIEEVIKGLECCYNRYDCEQCPYATKYDPSLDCIDKTRADAIELLKEQQAKKGKWIPVAPDTRGYTNQFECPHCGSFVHLGTYEKECDYDYCPYCGSYVADGEQE